MHMNDEELVEEFASTRDLSQSSKIQYRHELKSYTDYHEKSLWELLQEAEKKETTSYFKKK